MSRYNRQQDRRSGLWMGLIFLVIGVFMILKKLDMHFPSWLFSWEMALIIIGIIIGAKKNFQGAAWIILVCIGGVFMLSDILNWSFNMARFTWPLILVMVGIFLIVQSTERRRTEILIQDGETSDDYIAINDLFSGSKKTILTKNFRGGYISSTFSGCEINLTQADIEGTAVLDVQCLFAGVELVVPANWEVRIDINPVFGGIDDKRAHPLSLNANKVLLIKGSCTFGGVDIKSF